MFDKPLLSSEMNRRFGDRFSGLYLTYVDVIYWPVWRHQLRYKTYEVVPLDALEEGLLLLILAGVETVERAASLLGCSKRYALEMAKRLGADVQGASYLRLDSDEHLSATKLTSVAIDTVQRRVPIQQLTSLLRDALFGEWLSFGATPFESIPTPDMVKGAYRWLAPEVSADVVDDGASTKGLEETQVREIVESNFSTVGVLEWAAISVAVYQPEFGAGGRYLLFNPVREDEPLTSLSISFENLLLQRSPQMYFRDDQALTSTDVWDRFASRIRVVEKQKEIEADELLLQKADETIYEYSRALPQKVIDFTRETGDGQSSSAEIEDLKFEIYELRQKLDDQKAELAAKPRIEYIEARAHPAFVKTTIAAAKTDLVMICPWIKWRVLGPLLPEIDAAMKRGCRVWIGYGMPPNASFPEKSDQIALDELRKRERSGLLRLAYLVTHAKILIQDDEIFLNGSYNFLSYSGGDGRGELGTIQRGGFSQWKQKFIDDIASVPHCAVMKPPVAPEPVRTPHMITPVSETQSQPAIKVEAPNAPSTVVARTPSMVLAVEAVVPAAPVRRKIVPHTGPRPVYAAPPPSATQALPCAGLPEDRPVEDQ